MALQDFEASTSMAPVIEEMKLNGFVRTAIRLVRGVEIKHNEDVFEFGVFSVIKWFKVSGEWTGLVTADF